MQHELKFFQDNFNGVVITTSSLPENPAQCAELLLHNLAIFELQNKKLIWATLTIEQSNLISAFTDLGFHFHSCTEQSISLVKALVKDAEIPFVPTHSIGAGALVRAGDKILVIRETNSKSAGFKLPGGHIDLGETIAEAAAREVLEETGVIAKFDSICGLAGKYPYQFGKANLYFVCCFQAISTEIKITRADEIAEAKWVDIHAFLADENNSSFNKESVKAAFYGQGMPMVSLPYNVGKNAKQEVYFTNTEK